MRAGYGKKYFTPPLGVELAGYGYYLKREAKSVRDPLCARALALEDGGKRWLCVSCDALGLSRAIVDGALSRLAGAGIGAENAMIVSIHTHTGPALKYHEGCGETDPRTSPLVEAAIVAAAEEALSDLRHAERALKVESPIGEVFSYNRTEVEGPMDTAVRGLLIERCEAAPIALISYACHPVTNGRADFVSADYPGALCALAEADGLLPIYLNGLCGDIDPRPGVPREAAARAIYSAYKAGLSPMELQSLDFGRLRAKLTLAKVTREEVSRIADRAIASAEGADDPRARVARIWEGELLSRESLPESEDIGVAWARVGGVALAALPFEAFTRTGALMRERLPGLTLMALGCAEELLGYLPTRADMARGAYAALESAFLYKRLPPAFGEAERLGELIGDALRGALN